MQKITEEIRNLKQEVTELKSTVLKSNKFLRLLIEKMKRDLKVMDHKQDSATIRINKIDTITVAIHQNLTDILESEDIQEYIKNTRNPI